MHDDVYFPYDGKWFQIQVPMLLARFFEKREYAEQFQNGLMRMGNAAIYRMMENIEGDEIRGDSNEHKIPFYAGAEVFGIKDLVSDEPMYMTTANNFICCFYAYKANNIVHIDSEFIQLGIKNKSDKFEEKWKYAVLVDYKSLCKAFENASAQLGYKAHMLVRYFDFKDQEVANNYNLGIKRFYETRVINKHTPPPLSFAKGVEYSNQQEYRFVIGDGHNQEALVNEIRGVVKDEFRNIDIGDISQFSIICEAEHIISKHILMDIKNSRIKFIEREKDST